jgi:phosphate transport system permease protein
MSRHISVSPTIGPPSPRSPAGLQAPDLSARRRPGETAVRAVLLTAALLSVATTMGIFAALLRPALDFFADVRISAFLGTTRWAPNAADPAFGVWPLVSATLMITVVALLLAIPLGLGAAMYLSEYAGKTTRRRLKPVLELLAGIPSVVYGFFALTFVTPRLLQDVLHVDVGFTSALSAGLVLGVMIIPTIASLSEDAMSAVPLALRQGSFAMGANRMQTTLRVVCPAALSGIAAAVILGLSRAVGETMIVTLAAGSQPNFSADPREGMQAMTGYIATTAGGENPVGSTSYNTLFAVGLALFVMTLVINAVSVALVRRYRQEY